MITAAEAPARDGVVPDHDDACTHDHDTPALPACPPRSRAGAAPGYRTPRRLGTAIRLLFVEARRRRRRRRVAFALVSAALVVAVAIGYGVTAGYRDRPAARRGHRAQVVAPRRFDLPPATVAWFDASGELRIGGVASLAQRVVARIGNGTQPCCVTVAVGHRLYWATVLSRREVVQDYDFATGTIRIVAAGWAVFRSARAQAVYIAQSSTRLLEVSAAAGPRIARRLVTPPGWHVVPLPWATADGIVVSRGDRSGQGPRPIIGIWRPRTGAVKIIGRGHVLATVTPPAGSYSLIAWQPNGCGFQHCPLNITNTATHATVTVRSPLRYGFLNQGDDVAFSPDGSELVGFISLNALNPNQPALFVPALVNTRTAAVRVLQNAVLENDELGGWAVWLPGRRLIVGPSKNPRYPAYEIDARSRALRPFTFFPRSSDALDDITYGAVLLPPSDTAQPRRTP